MNRFRKLGYIEYNGHIRVNKSLLNAVLHDQMPGQNASQPELNDLPSIELRKTKRTKKKQGRRSL
jgi:CRP/FNR family transcriptional regulator, cyclic AMP receptor protein